MYFSLYFKNLPYFFSNIKLLKHFYIAKIVLKLLLVSGKRKRVCLFIVAQKYIIKKKSITNFDQTAKLCRLLRFRKLQNL